MGTPCNKTDKLLLAASTEIQIGGGKKISFWHSVWTAGRRPKDIAPDIYALSRRKNRKLHEALSDNDNQWIRDIMLRPNITKHHLQQFIDLWVIVRETANGEYSAASAYRAQFLSSIATKLQPLIWKPWATQKCKFFAWLIIKNRVWTSDRLATRGWPRNDVCPFCRVEPESAHHLLVTCHFTRRVWSLIAGWVHYHQLLPSHWGITHSVKEWWHMIGNFRGMPSRPLKSFLLLVYCEIWKERNGAFRALPFVILSLLIEIRTVCACSFKKKEISTARKVGYAIIVNLVPIFEYRN
ncbi:hypothetical protein PAHAL_4G258500 [Panicum hallii]|uniref:Reverse transcriptase zinc-binding domain-containing protein n=1 Tax=Panicum hallii TaxID=206008 RepID=A0A2T8JE04_9POAL|nr:hypothetical protein PAHAL_4G258500 [Panicum hallii]